METARIRELLEMAAQAESPAESTERERTFAAETGIRADARMVAFREAVNSVRNGRLDLDTASRHVAETVPAALRPRIAVSAADCPADWPERRLWAAGQGGAILSAGTVGILTGAGGVAKSALAGAIALGVADLEDGKTGQVCGNLFEARGGPALMALYEDPPGVAAWRLKQLSASVHLADRGAGALKRVHLLDVAGRPLFGPLDTGDGRALYNARPGPLSGWEDLWREATRTEAQLIIVDPALAGFVGEANAAAPVREFLAAVTAEARHRSACVLIVAHSTKAARGGSSDPYDPGQVAGSAAWTDGVRAALTMTWEEEERVLAIAKANYGPARLLAHLEPIRTQSGAIVGFGGSWEDGRESSTGGEQPPFGGRPLSQPGEALF